jgi:hypothetical protein
MRRETSMYPMTVGLAVQRNEEGDHTS